VSIGNVQGVHPHTPAPKHGANHSHGPASAMLYIAEAMAAKVNSSKNCQIDSAQANQKQAIQKILQAINSIANKKAVLEELKKALAEAHESGMVSLFVTGLDTKVSKYQAQIEAAIKKVQDALAKLKKDMDLAKGCEAKAAELHAKYEAMLAKARGVHTHWYEPWTYAEKAAFYAAAAAIYVAYGSVEATVKLLHTKFVEDCAGVNLDKGGLKKKMQSLNDKINKLLQGKDDVTSASLKSLMADFKQLLDLVKQQLESGWFTQAASWLGESNDISQDGMKNIESTTSNKFLKGIEYVGQYIMLAVMKTFQGICSLFSKIHHFCTDRNITSDAKDLGNKGNAEMVIINDSKKISRCFI